MKRFSILWLLTAGLLLLGACIGGAGDTSDRAAVTFMAGFKPQANLPFVAAYMADVKGFFDDEDLDVTIQHSSGQGEHVKLLAAGQIQMTTATAADLLKRRADPGVPMVAIALFGQRSDQAFAVLANSGIESPKDWEGKVVGYKSTPSADYLAILTAVGVDRDSISEVSVGFDPRILTEGRIDVYPVFASNEPYILRNLGFDVRVFHASEFGIDTMGLTYATTEDWLAENPDLAERFLRAALKGAAYAIDNPAEAVAEIMRRAPEGDAEHQAFMLAAESAAALQGLDENRRIGWMTRDQWESQLSILERFGVVQNPVNLEEAFSTALLERIYAD